MNQNSPFVCMCSQVRAIGGHQCVQKERKQVDVARRRTPKTKEML